MIASNVLNASSNDKVRARDYSPLALAYIGDGVYEIFIRTYVLEKGNMPVNKLHKASKNFVCADGQAKIYYAIENLLNEEELAVLKRGRNAKSVSAPKNADIRTYRLATGVEALIGYLYLQGNIERIKELVRIGIEELEGIKNEKQ
ncbi:ribonuclease III [Candidatus Epulonipiscium fishelsonii]|uniref:Ribonuclease III n=1 Tax=Candidatus Epulonipiscium fishelsonii TaxID=77094 RepID=A0ACC8XDV3_9FIRM|nr:ribonuclease III [Epulopiscium sp. SCG-B05WGA-EpuloA1]ONI41043.1 ribonuclease III [Epulopiscium sp. SCG-B11WGA-EpuloA1]